MQREISGVSWIVTASIVLVLSAGIVSAVPVTQTLTYQGKLTDAAGNPLTGSYTVRFNLYDVASGGAALTTDTHSVTASNGLFTTTIQNDPIVVDGRPLWLGIKVGADPEMTPRQDIRPVPYALSLRPGAIIIGSQSPWTLRVQNSAGTGLDATTSNDFHPGLLANTSGDHSSGLHSETHGGNSPGMSAITVGFQSPGVHTETHGQHSTGISTTTAADNSSGVYAETHGQYSPGLSSNTTSLYSPGVGSETHGDYSPGLITRTSGLYSVGVLINTTNANSAGLRASTWGPGSHGVQAIASGDGADGIHAYSDKFTGVAAITGNATHQWGVYTPDKMSALAYETNSGDIAEFMPVAENVAPGTVLVIGKGGVLRPSATVYDTHVAGIVSTQPGVLLGTKEAGNPGEAMVAVAGIVPCNVDTSNGPILEGDLLTTSSRPGYAMKAADPKIGTILGKAMGTLESGTGTIEVLVTLQ
jgi:hypothetical protein